MSEYTKEPWEVKEMNNTPYVIADRETLLLTHGWKGYHENMANARRIVACVNACRGIPTEDLERNKVEIPRAVNGGVFAYRDRAESEKSLADELWKLIDWVTETQKRNYGNATNLHIDMLDWPRKIDVLAKHREMRGK